MYNMKNTSGITFIEMLITLVISSIMFLYVGMLLLKTNTIWLSGASDVAQMANLENFQTRLGYDYRNGFSTSTVITGNTLRFSNISGSIVNVRWDGNGILYQVGNAPVETILTDVSNYSVLAAGSGPPPDFSSIKMDFTQTVRTTYATTPIARRIRFTIAGRSNGG
jgi:hypothetical protein